MDADKRKIITVVRNIGGRLEASLKNGAVLIASFDNGYVEFFRGHPLITLIGGVTFKGRRVRKTTAQKA